MFGKKLLFLLLMIILSPFIIVLVVLYLVFILLYLPIDLIIYRKYKGQMKYTLLFSIRKRKEIKELKTKNQV